MIFKAISLMLRLPKLLVKSLIMVFYSESFRRFLRFSWHLFRFFFVMSALFIIFCFKEEVLNELLTIFFGSVSILFFARANYEYYFLPEEKHTQFYLFGKPKTKAQ